MSYDQELTGLRQAIDGWYSVGRMSREQELIQLAHLIERYPEQARQMLAHRDADTA